MEENIGSLSRSEVNALLFQMISDMTNEQIAEVVRKFYGG